MINKGNTFKDFYEEVFTDVYEVHRNKIHVLGKKLFFNTGTGVVIAIEFTGPNPNALINITLTASTKYGVIDLTEIPLTLVFYKGKDRDADKTVLIKKLNSEDEHLIRWQGELSDEDFRDLNELVMNYIEIFFAIQ